jgi:hypothetical protein
MGGTAPKRSSLGGESTPFRGAVVSKATELLQAGRLRTTISQETSPSVQEIGFGQDAIHPKLSTPEHGRGGEDRTKKSDEKVRRREKEKAMRKAEKKKGKTNYLFWL